MGTIKMTLKEWTEVVNERDALKEENEMLRKDSNAVLWKIAEVQKERDALKERCIELEARLDINYGNMYDVVCAENEKLRKDNLLLKTNLAIATEALEKIYYRGGPPSKEVNKALSELKAKDERT